MNRKVYEQDNYGEYLAHLIKKHNYSHSKFAKLINVSRTYLYDLLSNKVKPPAPQMQEKIILVLNLSGDEKEEFYNKTAAGRDELPKDVFEYLFNNTSEISMIRERMKDDYG